MIGKRQMLGNHQLSKVEQDLQNLGSEKIHGGSESDRVRAPMEPVAELFNRIATNPESREELPVEDNSGHPYKPYNNEHLVLLKVGRAEADYVPMDWEAKRHADIFRSRVAMLAERERKIACEYMEEVLEELKNIGLPEPLPTKEELKRKGDLYKPGTDPYEHLKRVYHPWLKHFTKTLPRDFLYQDQLRRIDQDLLNALRAKRMRIKRDHNIDVKVLVKPRSARIDVEAAELTEEERKNMARLIRASERRAPKKA